MDSEMQDRLFANLVTVADHLVAGLEIMDLTYRLMAACIEMLPVSSAGLLVQDDHGDLRVLATSSDDAQELELLAVHHDEGPCFDAFRSGEEVLAPDLRREADRWPSFAPAAVALGIVGSYAVPLKLSGRSVGILNLFLSGEDGLSHRQQQVARLMAHLAAVGILNHDRTREQEQLASQLQTALESRIVIEQAKGVIAARAGVGMGAAFDLMRSAARAAQRPLADVANDVVRGHLAPGALASQLPRRDAGR